MLGRSFRTARPGTQPGATTCAFLGGPEGTINVSVSPSSSKQDFDDMRQLLTEQGEKVEAVTGLGDDPDDYRVTGGDTGRTVQLIWRMNW